MTQSTSYADTADQAPTMFEAAARLIRNNIMSGQLIPGVVLQESALAERLSTSRATVKRALAVLADENLIQRFEGRGFLVAGGDGTPIRLDLRRLELDLDGFDETVGQPNWLRIQDSVAAELSRCLVFGRYRVVEALVAKEFDVSRTVVRDVLSRLQERGLVQKSSNSRWVVEPLTAHKIKNKFELRMVLEIAALQAAEAGSTELGDLADKIRSVPSTAPVPPETWFELEEQFFDLAILSTPNDDLAQYVRANRSALNASQRVLFSLGLPPDRQSLLELCLVIDLLRAGTRAAAANMLGTHLQNALNRTIAQLKIVSVIDPPTDLAPYLVRD
ncbi:DNA-binding transcriptional regulator, GntR family [Poseidonocella pacifica]|uniref:DNA-binding transcriptional regulator, GntR family n=1 Tax=Poseidonocella pacifica TaxID=871651 RepID=A0A1I0X759_9RHOB|nr:GntR family transcriptional regulator [Poseidonocella pacifica]SFA96168.1 DNA-binding transcriptional regulator, GntR family [Poseidonocella pacifica]